MAQRWMQAKDQLARKHGSLSSGASRPIGSVVDDLPRGRGAEPKPLAPKGHMAVKAGSVQCFKAARPKPWGASRKAKLAAQGYRDVTFTASSRVICK